MPKTRRQFTLVLFVLLALVGCGENTETADTAPSEAAESAGADTTSTTDSDSTDSGDTGSTEADATETDTGDQSELETTLLCTMQGCSDETVEGCMYRHGAIDAETGTEYWTYEGVGEQLGVDTYALNAAISACYATDACVGISHQFYMPDESGWFMVSSYEIRAGQYGRVLVKDCIEVPAG